MLLTRAYTDSAMAKYQKRYPSLDSIVFILWVFTVRVEIDWDTEIIQNLASTNLNYIHCKKMNITGIIDYINGIWV